MQNDDTFDPALTLDDITNRHPETIEVFNRLGMDVCCGGGVPLREAAARDGVDLARVQEALRGAVAGRAARVRP